MDILILGGGASGMACALAAAQNPQNRVTVLERQARVGRKLLSTGNGRCNLTNLHAAPEDYAGGGAAFCAPALRAFPPGEILRLFRELGLLTTAEPDGRVYPLSDHAGSVVDVLRFALARRENLRLCTAQCVMALRRKGAGFAVETETDRFFAHKVVVACGGAAGGKLGGTADGCRLLESLGHRRVPLRPALVPLRTDPVLPRSCKGVKADVAARLLAGGRELARETGELLFTETGVSGPVGFALSRSAAHSPGPALTLELDFLRDYSLEDILYLLRRRAEDPALEARELFTGCLHSRLGQMLCRAAGIPAAPMSTVTPAQLQAAAETAKGLVLPVLGATGLDQAQVTVGGADTREFDPETLESRLCPGVYACGEVLDVDGPCGGYNLQWAWSSGLLAGRNFL